MMLFRRGKSRDGEGEAHGPALVSSADASNSRRGLADVLRPVSPRGAAFATVIVLALVGASVGAATHAEPAASYRAEAVVTLSPPGGGDSPSAAQIRTARYVAEIVKLPLVVNAARSTIGIDADLSDITDDIRVGLSAGTRLVRVDAAAPTQDAAVALSNALAFQAISFTRSTFLSPRDGTRTLGDFEEAEVSEWRALGSTFNTPPERVAQTSTAARFGEGSLTVTCPNTPACGPATRIYGYFRRGVTYTVRAWARSTPRARVGAVLGASPRDLAATPRVPLGSGWTRLIVNWTPEQDAPFAEVAFQTGSRATAFEVDGVSLFDPLVATDEGLPRGVPRNGDAAASQALALARSASLVPGRPLGIVEETPRTVLWTVIGGAIGLLVGLTAAAAGLAAHRRKQA